MRAYDIKTISDEVVTAFCRLGPFFASEEVFQIRPDIITSAKGLTSGYQPMSATLISDEIYEVISAPGDFFLHGMTYSGHPACCAAALANIALMEQEDLPNRVKHTGKSFENTMKGLLDLDIVGDVRGSHFMIGIEFVSDKATKQIFGDDIMIGKRVAREAQARGLVVRPLGHMAVLSPPLILTEKQIDQIGTILRESIMAVQNQLG
jgi:adenosylmethionine-8-amino-7-oxononanoate aminotransferase